MCGAAPRRDAEGRVGMDGEPPAVYVVDDDASVLLSLKRLLSGFGFEVFSYLTAEGFLQDHETGRDGCVILDLMMPGMGGQIGRAARRERGCQYVSITVVAGSL